MQQNQSMVSMTVSLMGAAGACALMMSMPMAHAQTPPSAPMSIADADWRACLQRLQSPAQQAGVKTATWQALMTPVTPDSSVLDKLNNQPEFKTPIWDYLAGLVDEERIHQGQQLLKEHHTTLKRVQEVYGVAPATVTAVWGVESNFGQSFGRYPLLQALGTLSCFGRRQAFFQQELFATLRIVQGGHVSPTALVGSWAGAFGHTQFMPTTYERLAVDFDEDGRRDLTASIPDALASTAHFLKKAGWQTGLIWGVEVRLPPQWSGMNEGRVQKKPLRHWMEQGITTVGGQTLETVFPAGTLLGLIQPAEKTAQPGLGRGPAFLVSKNFDALYSYNAAESYGLAIAHLSDRLEGRGAFLTAWPTDDLGLSRQQRRELQTLLTWRGHDIGEIDGLLGAKSQAAIRVEQARLGHPPTGRAGQKLFKSLQSSTSN